MSLVTGRPVRRDVAMTGEITLRGRVLAVGGVKEKLLAAARAGLARVLLPKGNEADFAELTAQARKQLDVVFVSHLDEVLGWALVAPPEKKARAGKRAG